MEENLLDVLWSTNFVDRRVDAYPLQAAPARAF
jgi:hypothetical protein